MALNETAAIILRTYNLADADKVVVCLTQKFGVVRAVAKGARRIKSRFGAGLEPFTVVSITYYEREGRELVSLREAEIVRSSFNLTKHADSVSALAYMGELIIEFTPPHEPNEKIFRMVKSVLEALSNDPDRAPLLIRYFEIWILKLSGFLPDLTRCSGCGVRFSNESVFYAGLDLRILCKSCLPEGITTYSNSVYNYINKARRLSPELFADGFKHSVSVMAEELNQLAIYSGNLIRRVLEKPIRANVVGGK